MKINKKYHCSYFFLSKTEIQGLLHPVQDNLGYFIAWFQSLLLPQRSLKVLLLLNPMCLLNYVLNCEQNFKFFLYPCRD
jgi:hypothetical protein